MYFHASQTGMSILRNILPAPAIIISKLTNTKINIIGIDSTEKIMFCYGPDEKILFLELLIHGNFGIDLTLLFSGFIQKRSYHLTFQYLFSFTLRRGAAFQGGMLAELTGGCDRLGLARD